MSFIDSSRPTVEARLYPIEYLPDFRMYFNDIWLPQKAQGYFAKDSQRLLPFLSQIGPTTIPIILPSGESEGG